MSSKRSKKQRRRGSKISKTSERTLKPRLGDFKRRRIEDESIDQISNTQNVGRMRRVGQGARSLRTRQMNNIFDDFRNSIESILNPSFLLGDILQVPVESVYRKTKLESLYYDVVDRGDKYEVTVELPGIDKDNIRISAMDDSIEISAEQLRDKDERKKGFSYSQRTFSSFYCTIPVPAEILSSEVTARSDNRGILRINLPKKAPTRQEIKGRSIMVE
jgi:HSP20 family protein